MKPLLEDAARRAAEYLASLPKRHVAPDPEAVRRLSALDVPLQEEPHDAHRVLAELDELVTPATMAMAGPRFFGFVIGGSLPAALAANWLAGAWDQNAGMYSVTPGVAHLEQVVLRWLNDLFGLPAATTGALVTGATMANFTALAAARHAVLERAGWNVEADGLYGAPPVTVVVGDEVHITVLKALGMLGLGRNRVVRVPADEQGRIRAGELPRIDGPTIVCVQAGNVNSGSFDPLAEVCECAHEAAAWVHVDGAFGLWAKASPHYAHLLQGMERADSWSTDAHKWLNVPYDCGIALVRDTEALAAAMAIQAAYIPAAQAERNPFDYTPEFSRRARGVEVWAALRSLGRRGLAALIERNCAAAQRFAERLKAAGCEILNDVVLNQVLVSFGRPEETERVIAAVQADGTCWAGGTVWQRRTAMRISVCSWATTESDVDASVAAMLRARDQVASGLSA
ncbi:MAG TPA: pyridoxal-dependent decarboxylase [Gammaproteobacteria bacterium]|nr:pyridoxal-dependent decarboxylase [Gammaproteobacteria bacterium]